ncbi:proteasome subunit beta [Candidatus Woesearchaeota archaeon]|nr:proteasome subunit beta [Candidatus Woesearchaeota archaeon]
MEDNINDIVKKGTTTVGIVCKDGIILAADKRATFAGRIVANKDVDKIFKISENMAITTAGTVSDVQLITKLIKAELTLIRIRTGSDPSVKTTANLLGTIVYQNIRKFSPILGITGFILGGKDDSGFYLYELGPDGSVLEHKNYATDGSGMMMAWGVLDTLYKDGVNTNEGIKLAVKAVNAAIQRDAATGEAIDVYTIKTDGVKKVLTKKLETNIII